MFSYLRYFSVIAFLVVIVAATFLGIYFRQTATDDLVSVVNKNNGALVTGFLNQLYEPHPMAQMVRQFQASGIPVANWRRYRGYKETYEDFSQKTYHYFEQMPIVQLTIYTKDGEPVLTVNQANILDDPRQGVRFEDAERGELLKQARTGETQSLLRRDAQFMLPNGQMSGGALVQTVMPILSDTYVPLVDDPRYSKEANVEAVVEVFYDVTPQMEALYNFQYIGTGAVVLIFVLLIATLIFVGARAETIIAKQHEANLELAAQAAAAEAENRNKSQFLANISHELRTPLNAIIGFSEIIKNEVMGQIDNPQYQDYIRDIHASGVHLLSLINDILDYSKAEAGKLDISIAEVDVTKTVKNSMRLVSPRAEQGQIALVEDVPREHYILQTDAKKLKQIMLNLLSNAVKFTAPGGSVKVTMWQNVVDGSLTIEVKDTGIGIAPKDIGRALAPFGQVDSALSRRYEGTGLGLPLTKKFVELLGGSFNLASEENVGTTVTVTLPKDPPAGA